MKDSEDNNGNEELLTALTSILEKHYPQGSENRYTTTQICEFMQRLYPGEYGGAEIYNILLEGGYTTEKITDTVYWCVG